MQISIKMYVRVSKVPINITDHLNGYSIGYIAERVTPMGWFTSLVLFSKMLIPFHSHCSLIL